MNKLRQRCKAVFYGTDKAAERARYLMLCFDVLIIAYFVFTTFLELQPWIGIVDIVLGLWLAAEFIARALADDDLPGFLLWPMSILDVFIIVSLFIPAVIGSSFVFLRVIRALRITRSYVVTRRLRKNSKFFASNEEVIFSALNLLVFIFVVTAVVFVMQQSVNASINNYVDAFYFTVTTLTTTGFGDITLEGSAGRMLAVVIMMVGVALFIRLVQSIFRPSKIRHECPTCGLTRHEIDAVHCKHCGQELHIRTEGVN